MYGRRVITSIHGIESDGKWQEEIDPSFDGIHELFYRRHKYGRFRFWKVAVPFLRRREVKRFVRFYDELYRTTATVPSVIAHSFGTYIISRALHHFPAVRFRNVVLCGSVVARDYDWPTLIKEGRVVRVRNEMSRDDNVVRLFRKKALQVLIPGTGPSGIEGFTRSHASVVDMQYEFGHSGQFILLTHCDRYWRPWLCENEVFADVCDRCINGPSQAGAMTTLRQSYAPELQAKLAAFFPAASPQQVTGLFDGLLYAFIELGATGKYTPEQLANFLAQRSKDMSSERKGRP